MKRIVILLWTFSLTMIAMLGLMAMGSDAQAWPGRVIEAIEIVYLVDYDPSLERQVVQIETPIGCPDMDLYLDMRPRPEGI